MCDKNTPSSSQSIASSQTDAHSQHTTVIEVYEYPNDCVASELSYHFSRQPYLAESLTPLHTIWNYRSSTFVLEFPASDAVRIVQDPIQFLDETDPNSEIRLSLLDVRRCAQVLVTSEHELNYRMIKHFFGKFGKLDSCQESCGTMEYSVILTFKDRSVAEKVCLQKTHSMGPPLTVRTQLFTDALVKGEPSSPTSTAFTLDFDLDSVSCAGTQANLPKHIVSCASDVKPLKDTCAIESRNEESESQNDFRLSTVCDDETSDDSYLAIEPTSSLPTLDKSAAEPETMPKQMASEDDSHHYETIELKAFLKESEVDLDPTKETDAPPPPPSPIFRLQHSVPTIRLHSCIQVNNCIIRLIHGDISEHMADVLVHSGGEAAHALYRKQYFAQEQAKRLESLTVPNHGFIKVTTAPNLPARYVFGIRFNPCLPSLASSKKEMVSLCLQHCTVLKVKSIALPAVGTGLYNARPTVMASALISSIVEHMKKNAKSTLEIIDIVIYQNSLLEDYAIAMKQEASVSRSSNFSNLLSKHRSKIENVYQVSNKSHRVQIDK